MAEFNTRDLILNIARGNIDPELQRSLTSDSAIPLSAGVRGISPNDGRAGVLARTRALHPAGILERIRESVNPGGVFNPPDPLSGMGGIIGVIMEQRKQERIKAEFAQQQKDLLNHRRAVEEREAAAAQSAPQEPAQVDPTFAALMQGLNPESFNRQEFTPQPFQAEEVPPIDRNQDQIFGKNFDMEGILAVLQGLSAGSAGAQSTGDLLLGAGSAGAANLLSLKNQRNVEDRTVAEQNRQIKADNARTRSEFELAEFQFDHAEGEREREIAASNLAKTAQKYSLLNPAPIRMGNRVVSQYIDPETGERKIDVLELEGEESVIKFNRNGIDLNRYKDPYLKSVMRIGGAIIQGSGEFGSDIGPQYRQGAITTLKEELGDQFEFIMASDPKLAESMIKDRMAHMMEADPGQFLSDLNSSLGNDGQ